MDQGDHRLIERNDIRLSEVAISTTADYSVPYDLDRVAWCERRIDVDVPGGVAVVDAVAEGTSKVSEDIG